jgi:hypothetical protein
MTDFGADQSFAKAATKVKEHYGIEVPVGAVRTTTEVHGESIQKNAPLPTGLPDRPGVPQLIAELDGSMIPQVEIASAPNGEERVDRRQLRQLKWRACVWRMNRARSLRFLEPAWPPEAVPPKPGSSCCIVRFAPVPARHEAPLPR